MCTPRLCEDAQGGPEQIQNAFCKENRGIQRGERIRGVLLDQTPEPVNWTMLSIIICFTKCHLQDARWNKYLGVVFRAFGFCRSVILHLYHLGKSYLSAEQQSGKSCDFQGFH